MAATASVSFRIYVPGAEGYNTIEPWAEHDVLARSFPGYPSSPTDDRGVTWPSCELIPEAGCVRPRLFRAPVSQTLADWTLTGGSWSVYRPAGYSHDVLLQADAAEDTAWTAETLYQLPENPRFELMLSAYPSNRNQNFSDYPPYLIIELGNYRVWQNAEGRTLFCYLDDGEWLPIGEFPWEVVSAPGFLWWDPIAGGISISTDWGRSRYLYGTSFDMTRTAVNIEATRLKIYGQGHALDALALNELDVDDGYFTSTPRGTYEDRGGVFSPVYSRWHRLEKRSGITAEDKTATAPAATTQYRITFNTHRLAAGGDDNDSFIDVHRIPSIWAVDMEQAPTQVGAVSFATPGNYTELSGVHSIEINHTPESGWTTPQTCTITMPVDWHDAYPGDYRNRFCIVFLGDYRGTGVSTAFYGMIVDDGFRETADGTSLYFNLVNSAMIRAQRVGQEQHWPVMGGRDDVTGRNLWMDCIGLPRARASWTDLGITLPPGDPRDPFGAPREGAPALELLHRMDNATQKLTYFDVANGYIYDMHASAYATVGSTTTFYRGPDAAIAAGANQWRVWDDLDIVNEGATELVTRWKVVGETLWGDYISERATDWAAERQTGVANFVGYPVLRVMPTAHQDQGIATLAARAAYDTQKYAWKRVTFRSPGYRAAKAPMWAYINGSQRIGNTDPVRVLAVRHKNTLGEYWTEYDGVTTA